MMNKEYLKIAPNFFSLLRILLIPVLLWAFYSLESGVYCALIFVFAALTDLVDGVLARKLSQVSKFGAFIDPVADKMLVVMALILVVVKEPRFIIVAPVILIIMREIAISGLREWLAMLNKREVVAVSWWGKIKTVLQVVAITLLLYHNGAQYHDDFSLILGTIILYLSALFSLGSLVNYCIKVRYEFKKH